jgi:hypothetical protein
MMKDELAALEKEQELFTDFATRFTAAKEQFKRSVKNWPQMTEDERDDFILNVEIVMNEIAKDQEHIATELRLVQKCHDVIALDDIAEMKAALKAYVQYDVQMNLKSLALRRYDYGGTLERLEALLQRNN